MHKCELLAPAGKYDAIEPLIDAGADAVYVGLQGFSSRPVSSDLSLNEIRRAVDLCHSRGVQLYVAVNSCIAFDAADRLLEAIKEMDAFGVDAVIIADWGIIERACRMTEHIRIHASTLLGVYNSETVRLLREMGVKRIVFSTNLYLDEMASIVNSVPELEYEIVADGGICFNDNRICELPHTNEGEDYRVFCRLDYQLSNGDIAQPANPIAAEQITSTEVLALYMEMGIMSFKVEGRTVDPEKILPRIHRLRAAMDAVPKTSSGSSVLHYVCTRNNPEVKR